MPEPETAERLLADSRWLTNLTRRLVGDDLAADLRQDVALAALRQPVTVGRSWLATVAHNLAVTLRRRRTAERRRAEELPAPEPAPSPAELVATAELQQRAVAAVLALPEAQRDTVLMRFLEGLSVQATAAAMGVPAETVRTRQRRALATLRNQLAPAPRRRAFVVPLWSSLSWGSVMKTKHAAIAAALALLWLSYALWPPANEPPVEVRSGASIETGSLVGAASNQAVETTPERSEPAQTVAGEGQLEPGSAELRFFWRGTELPAPSLQLWWRSELDAPGRLHRVYADDRGVLRIPELTPGRYEVQWMGPSRSFEVVSSTQTRLSIEVAPAIHVQGHVVDASGRGVAGATVFVQGDADEDPVPRFVATADEGGVFRARTDRGGWCWARAPGHAASALEPLRPDTPGCAWCSTAPASAFAARCARPPARPPSRPR